MSNQPASPRESSSFNTKVGMGCMGVAIFPVMVFICTLAVLMALRVFGVV